MSTAKPSPYQEMPPKKSGGAMPWLVGCGVVFLVLLLLCGGGLYYSFLRAKQIGADLARTFAEGVVNESELSKEDKVAVIQQVDRVVDGFKAGKVTFEQVGTIMEQLVQSPLIAAAIVSSSGTRYVDPSGLTDDEKAAAKLTLQRVMRGVHEKKIDVSDLDEAQKHITEEIDDQPDPGNAGGDFGEMEKERRKLKDKLTDEELRAFIAECKKVADDAEIPEEPFEVNVPETIKKIVDDALGSN